jgi:acyl-CoA dehydrogenase
MSISVDRDQAFLDAVRRIADEVAAPNAIEVDQQARFPIETVEALREEGALSAFLPGRLGGGEVSFATVAAACFELGRRCGASAMVFAMHQIQVISVARHLDDAPWFEDYLRELAAEQRLIASVTSEIGTGGDMGRSVAAVTPIEEGRCTFEKQAPTVSYGSHADDLLVTLRRSPEAEPSDQVMVVVRREQYSLEQVGSWDPLGMRGTCSPGFIVRAEFSPEQVVPTPFAPVMAESMVPVSHILWSHLWLGIATDAFDRARAFARAAAKQKPGETPPVALRVSHLMSELSLLRAEVGSALDEFVGMADEPGRERLSTMAVVLRFNNLKIAASERLPRRPGDLRNHGLQERHPVQRRAPSPRHAVRLPDGRQRADSPDKRQPVAHRQGGLMAAVRTATPEQSALLAELLRRRLLVETGVPGLYGRGGTFEDVRERLAAMVTRAAAPEAPEQLRFPPILPRRDLEKVGYLKSFPHLAGSVFAFEGTEAEAAEQYERASRHEDWSTHQQMSELVLTPAACYPVYPAIAARGRLPVGGVTVDAGSAYVFRHEPSEDPARLQMFHQREIVRIGEPEAVQAWRERWRERALELLGAVGLEVALEIATDPFFGRSGRMLAASQREQQLKFEVLAHIAGPEPTALASFNYHQDHFASVYGIELADGSGAHTACLGFGLERITLALLSAHGFDPDAWPTSVREELWQR